MPRVTFTIPDTLLEAVDLEAKRLHISRGAYIRLTLSIYFEMQKGIYNAI